MKRGLARLGGGLALGISALLLIAVVVGGPGINLLNVWTIALCALAGVLAFDERPGLAALLLVVGALPALIGGVGFLFLPSLLLVGIAALTPAGTISSSK